MSTVSCKFASLNRLASTHKYCLARAFWMRYVPIKNLWTSLTGALFLWYPDKSEVSGQYGKSCFFGRETVFPKSIFCHKSPRVKINFFAKEPGVFQLWKPTPKIQSVLYIDFHYCVSLLPLPGVNLHAQVKIHSRPQSRLVLLAAGG